MAKPAVIAKLTAAPGQRDQLIEALGDLVAATADEPGTELYVLHEDAGNADVAWFWELYSDQAGFDAHGSSDAMKAVGAKLAGLIVPGGFELTFLHPVKATGLDIG